MNKFVYAMLWALGATGYAWAEPMNRDGKHAQTVCTMEYNPVCGSVRGKRRTFPNRCLAEREGAAAIVLGACDTQKSLVRSPSLDRCIAA